MRRGTDHAAGVPEGVTPGEQIGAVAAQADVALRTEIMQRLVAASPSFFERVVLDVLVAMGYGGFRVDAAGHLGRPGDLGVDGAIRLDPLGLEVIYLQAKRNRPERPVTPADVREFSGALVGKGARKGILLTTSSFTKAARECANTVRHQRIVLIDGAELTRLMVRHGVGVRTERIVMLQSIDLGYFEPT